MPDNPPVSPSPIKYAIGDLGPARRHLSRLLNNKIGLSPAVLQEIAKSIERCVMRLETLDSEGQPQKT